jgi:hypothetical protein
MVAMIGLIILLVGALVVGMTMDAAVDVRLSVAAMNMTEKRIRSELVAESLLELAVDAVQSDVDLSTDTLQDSWADTIQITGDVLSQFVPNGAHAVIMDLERFPPQRLLSTLGKSGNVSSGDLVHCGSWVNIMTASRKTWRTLGFSRDAATYLAYTGDWKNSTDSHLMAIESMEVHDRILLNRLLNMDVLKKRSELFLVQIDTTDGVFSAILHRSPSSGTVHLRAFTRSSA